MSIGSTPLANLHPPPSGYWTSLTLLPFLFFLIERGWSWRKMLLQWNELSLFNEIAAGAMGTERKRKDNHQTQTHKLIYSTRFHKT
ncbi:hypothetical protein DFP73DRAFT_367232 [Morchella snyderi]|nr:hypothetical protein DFP73DRAFT_367232 [Morchella snyderi]